MKLLRFENKIIGLKVEVDQALCEFIFSRLLKLHFEIGGFQCMVNPYFKVKLQQQSFIF